MFAEHAKDGTTFPNGIFCISDREPDWRVKARHAFNQGLPLVIPFSSDPVVLPLDIHTMRAWMKDPERANENWGVQCELVAIIRFVA